MMMAMLAVQPLSKIIPPPPPPPSVVCRLALYYAAPRSYCSIVLHCMVSQYKIRLTSLSGRCCPVNFTKKKRANQLAVEQNERFVVSSFLTTDRRKNSILFRRSIIESFYENWNSATNSRLAAAECVDTVLVPPLPIFGTSPLQFLASSCHKSHLSSSNPVSIEHTIKLLTFFEKTHTR